MNHEKNIKYVIKKNLNKKEIANIDKLHGDASYRVYYRISFNDGTSLIATVAPVGKSSPSEEVTNSTEKYDENPFINIANFFSNNKISVPRIYINDDEHGIIIQEDLGNTLLLNSIDGASSDKILSRYKHAIDIMLKIQSCSEQSEQKCIAFKRTFDERLLHRQLFFSYQVVLF